MSQPYRVHRSPGESLESVCRRQAPHTAAFWRAISRREEEDRRWHRHCDRFEWSILILLAAFSVAICAGGGG